MNKRYILVLVPVIFIFVLSLQRSFSQDEDEELTVIEGGVKIRPGMEVKKMGDANILVPKGGVLTRRGAEVHVEASDEWAARMLEKVDSRLGRLEEGQMAIKEEIRALREAIGSVGKMGSVLRSEKQGVE